MTRARLMRDGLALAALLALSGASMACSEGSDDDDGAAGDTGSGGTGGTDTGGAAGSGTGGGPGGGAGDTGSGGTGNVTVGEGWTFDSGDESWEVNFVEGITGTTLLSWDDAVGQPSPGSLQAEIPIDGPLQKAMISVQTGGLDLRGATITAYVRLDSGLNSTDENPGGAKVFVKTTDTYVWGDGGWRNLEPRGAWIPISITVDDPHYSSDGVAYDAADVREVGIEIGSGDVGAYETAVVHIDSVTY